MQGLLVLGEVVFLSQGCFCLFILVSEVVLPTRAEVDVPAPESADKRLGVLVILGPERAGFAGVLRHSEMD